MVVTILHPLAIGYCKNCGLKIVLYDTGDFEPQWKHGRSGSGTEYCEGAPKAEPDGIPLSLADVPHDLRGSKVWNYPQRRPDAEG